MAPDTDTGHGSHLRQLAAVIAAALAIGPLAGVASWQIGLHGHRGSMTTQAQSRSQPQGSSQTSSLPATGSAVEQPLEVSDTGGSSAPAASRVPGAASPPYLYLVDSAAQANEVQQRLDRAAIAWQPLDATVLVVAPEAAPDRVSWLRTTMNESRRLQGLAPVTVVDLRTPNAAATPQRSPPSYPGPRVSLGKC